MIDLEEKYINILKDIINDIVPGCRVYIFGSRAKKTSWKYSDVDLLICGDNELTPKERYALAEALDESDIPFRVDIVDVHELSEDFKQSIKNDCVELFR